MEPTSCVWRVEHTNKLVEEAESETMSHHLAVKGARWQDGSVGKVPAVQAGGPECDLQSLLQKAGAVVGLG